MGKVSNPYNFNIKQNYMVSSELNFEYNFSIVVGSWSVAGDSGYYGYGAGGSGTLITNNTGLDIGYFQTEFINWEYWGFCLAYYDRKGMHYHLGRQIILPTGITINYTSNDPNYCPDVTNMINYLRQNVGKQIYVRII